MPLKCPLSQLKESQGGGWFVWLCVSGGGLAGKGLGPCLSRGQAGYGRFMWGITNAPVTFSVNEKRGRANKRE